MRPALSRAKASLFSLFGIAACAIYLINASWLAPGMTGTSRILAHRGVHVRFDRSNLTNETCTAAQSLPPIELPIENTIQSMRAAFDMGAEVVELDVHRTADNRFAVFHDWTLDCRTNGSGETRSHDLATLQLLDMAYGYTSDGSTFPLRGQGVGLLPSLDDVMAQFPDGQFLIDFKSNDPADGELFAARLAQHAGWRDAVWAIYGGNRPVAAAKGAAPDLPAFTRESAEACLRSYILIGWTGRVPTACHNAIVLVPVDVAPFLWGWPNRFMQRMLASGSEVLLRGPALSDPVSDGVDDQIWASRIPHGFSGLVWTNDVPLLLAVIRGNDFRMR